MRLSEFIIDNLESILQSWEDFAGTIPGTRSMDIEALRDHAEAMLRVIAADLRTEQSAEQQTEKSMGKAKKQDETAAETHALVRFDSGFTIDEMVSEYRALRASVLRKWTEEIKRGTEFEVEDMTRFNEAIDQALAESVASYSRTANATRNVFLGILGHDLRTPLGAIRLGSEVLLLDNNLGVKPVLIASHIFSSAKRANKIVCDLLDFTRSQSSLGIPVRQVQTNLSVVCEGIVTEVKTYHPEREIVCEVEGGVTGWFDPARLEQVFSNLICNAVQHGSHTSPVTVTLYGKGEHAVFTVHNYGQPIPKEAIGSIYNPLSRHSQYAAAEYGSQSGLGLGLYIASEIIAAHQGRIDVDSNAEDGTTFTVSLPLAMSDRRVGTS